MSGVSSEFARKPASQNLLLMTVATRYYGSVPHRGAPVILHLVILVVASRRAKAQRLVEL
jgi:hypothetical protein